MTLSTRKKIIIIEQNPTYKDYLRSMISEEGGLGFCFQQETTCLDNLFQLDPELIVMGNFPQERSIRFMNALRAIDCNLPVIIFSEDPTVRNYMSVNRLDNMRLVDSLSNGPALRDSVKSVFSKKEKDKKNDRLPFVVGTHPDIVKLKQLLPELGRSKENIMLLGEQGVGKELLARAIHSHSDANGLFVKIDATALSAGDEKFRLIDYFKKILFSLEHRSADNIGSARGTLYVHEIGDLPTGMQAEMLIVTDTSGLTLMSDDGGDPNLFRIIVGTSDNLEQQVAKDRFRKDLFYRLSTLSVMIPPLRDRKDDIQLLADYFTYKFCKDFDKSFFELPPSIKKRFQNYQWPGNVQEMETLVKRAVMTNDQETFLSSFLMGKSQREFTRDAVWLEGAQAIDDMIDVRDFFSRKQNKPFKAICWDFMARVERKIIKKALNHTNWNRKKAAEMLSISYKSLLNKIKEYNIA